MIFPCYENGIKSNATLSWYISLAYTMRLVLQGFVRALVAKLISVICTTVFSEKKIPSTMQMGLT